MLRCRPVMLVCVQVAASIDVLIDHPDQWNLLRDNPELALPAVDETMRHSPIVGATMRITTEDVELAGVVIPHHRPHEYRRGPQRADEPPYPFDAPARRRRRTTLFHAVIKC